MTTVCLWSGPRNVSTALMYSFAERSDTEIVDEPLYGHFLRVTGTNHPGRDEVLANVNCNGDQVMREILRRDEARQSGLIFLKQMAHHLVDVDRQFLRQTRNILLIRDPREMLPSLTIQLPNATLADTGLKMQWELYEALRTGGEEPPVLDSRELLLNPRHVLSLLCDRLGVPFEEAMLAWPSGPRPEDGVWAPHWYHSVHASSGFAPYVAKNDFPTHLEPLLAECRPWYEKLYRHAIRHDSGAAH